MSAGLVTNDGINDALQRAKELAASATTLKRPNTSDDSTPAKRANMDGGMQGALISTLGGGMGMQGHGYAGGAPQMNLNENVVEIIAVPDNSVGLVIGKGGSEISQIQSHSGARVQMAPESTGDGTRQCTLQGTKFSVERAKQLIQDVINRAQQRRAGNYAGGMSGGGAGLPDPTGPNVITVDMLIPGTKCGLVIGKSGETIRLLQEQSGVKMQMIQDTTEATGQPKPLRMTGEPDKIEYAKRLVQDLLNSRNDDGSAVMGGGGGGGGMGGITGQAKGEVVVPRSSVGMIIGKGGETIKRLAMETGTKIQFKPDDPSLSERTAVITGTREQIYKATELITELVQKSCAQQGQGGGGGGGGGPMSNVQETFYMHVPANKTGLVIGKGGETIKQLCSESMAHVELSRDPPPNASEKVFIIKGTTYQIHHAQHLIRIKVGDIPPGTPVPPMGGGGGMGGPPMGGGFGGPSAPFNGGGFAPAQWNNSFGQPDQFQAANGWGGAPAAGGMPQQFYGGGAQQQFAMPQQAATAAGGYGGGAGGQQFGGAAVTAQTAAPTAQAAAQSAPAINPATGQADYSAQWAEYYRNMGLHDQAAKIEAQMRANQGGGAATAAAGQPAQQVQYAGGQYQPQAF